MLKCGLQNGREKKATLLVWDAKGLPPAGDWTTVLWGGFGDCAAPNAISIPRLLEANADRLRTRYLAWIYELGEMRINGRRLVDYLELRPGFSYWWMTLLAEKCNWAKSLQINDAIRLMAFEDWVEGKSIRRVLLVSPNAHLAESMRSLCVNIGGDFEWQRTTGDTERLSWARYLYQILPLPCQALMWLIHYLVHRWPLKGVGLRSWRETKGKVTFVSYLFNLDPCSVKEGRFESPYWAHLPDDLQREGCKTNWLHLYVKDSLLPNARKAAKTIRQLNEAEQGGQIHITLDAFLGGRLVIRTFCDWFRLIRVGRRLKQAFFLPRETKLGLWPLFQVDWQRSLFGYTALSNLLYYNLFESALESLPEQRVGVYLQENQGWEFAFIHTWKTASHGRLIGAPHSTVRYWDLRYFFDPRSYCRKEENGLPLPDQVALNGAAALDVYRKGGYWEGDLVEVEALRYLQLAEAQTVLDSVSQLSDGSFRVLVLGDYLLRNTQQQMHLLVNAVEFLTKNAIITVKPHPNCPIQLSDYPGCRMKVTMDPVVKLLSGCDVVYSSGLTSAAVEAYCAGVPVISMLDPNTLNLSPLRGREGVLFATTPEELARALVAALSFPAATEKKDFFTLDAKFPRWKKLLLESSVEMVLASAKST